MMSIVYEMIKRVLSSSKELEKLSEEEREKVYKDKYHQIFNTN